MISQVHKILTSAETIDNIIAATPGLVNDHVAVCEFAVPENEVKKLCLLSSGIH